MLKGAKELQELKWSCLHSDPCWTSGSRGPPALPGVAPQTQP